MTIPKKIKGVPLHKKEKKSTATKQLSKKTTVAKNDSNVTKKWQKNIKLEFEDEFLNNSLFLDNILE
ncbi:hypothetical protein QWY90_10825 [Flavobacterium paronense]|uniref:Uncharacterized protein n=1 Tax=Flavobacterium paronense TaxID=1392775 RepID=A0ABV5GC37_9FLAO|nr:hypothetical protein [Flavobacterium paronense]MDN3677802.1 hypothetical protein [Flavobacterium paronense]